MVNQEILKYIDDVMSQIDADDMDKIKMENDLIRRIFLSREHERYMPPKPYGEYMYEENETNIKLLHIPLIQISSGTQRIQLPIVDSCYEYEY